MRLLGISDLHGDHAALERILAASGPVDAIALAGDITHFGTPNAAGSLVQRVQRACPVVLAVAGNCDSAEIDQRLAELGVSLFRRAVVQDGCGFYGVSAMPPWRGGMYELSEDELEQAWRDGRAQLPTAVREVVVSHPPPQATSLDRTRRGEHVGSAAVRKLVDEVQPALVVCGHIHEARGVELLGETCVVNCGHGRAGEYALIEVAESIRAELRAAP